MATPRVCVLRAPGTNCDPETAHAFEMCGAEAERVHLLRVLEDPAVLAGFQTLCIPGGFSYGDDIGAGVIFSSHLRGRLSEAIREFLTADKLVLGICNGFQVLLKSGILPDGAAGISSSTEDDRDATLTWNDNGRYTSLWVRLANLSRNNVFLRGIDQVEMPIAHAEGRLVVRDPSILETWQENGQAALCYCSASGSTSDGVGGGDASGQWLTQKLDYPENPNGSFANIAGLGDSTGRVLGLMPHPERFIHATQHPEWTRRKLRGDGDGLKVFRNAVEYFA
ncbi:MAG: phosphoribosylformylglycinamidine synthase subunit PurQ [Planctomycetota bacterium]|nr:phosphoribosylformylglycinamidine synthase subunit PurQ [Planctomycetota bacterium]